jgi:hypothetical protein
MLYNQKHYVSETAEMAGSGLISFRGQRDPNGYHLAESAEYGPVILPNSDRREWCEPLTGEEYLIFAKTAGTAEGALGFVWRYGPVTVFTQAIPMLGGDRVEAITKSARDMNRFIGAIATMQAEPRANKGASGGRDGPIVAGIRPVRHIEDPRSEELRDALLPRSLVSIDLAFIWDPVKRAPRWSFATYCLHNALWLQFGQAMMREGQLRLCPHCGDWFETGFGTGRRKDARFCCDEHRVTFNNLKRSKKGE